jgi:hypothetical protein
MRNTHKQGERGFALLIVFLLAGAIALMLYSQMPRVAFESEREKEALLQDRGKQYVRAIQTYYVAFKKWPTKIEDLENTNNQRFLRRRYTDPMTGKDEWRLIHVNASGQLTDSLVQKPPAAPTPLGPSNTNPSNTLSAFATNSVNPTGATGSGNAASAGASTADPATCPMPPCAPEVNSTVLRRPSDATLVPQGSMATTPANVDPNDPRYWPPITTYTPAQISGQNGQTTPQQIPGQQQYPGQQFPGQQQYPGQPAATGPSAFSGQQYPGQQQLPSQQPLPGLPQYPGQPVNLPGGTPGQSQFPGTTQPNTSTIPGVPGLSGGVPGGVLPGGGVFGSQPNAFQPNAGQSNGAQSNSQSGTAGTGTDPLSFLNNGLRTQQTPTAPGGAIGSGGLAGVACTFKGPSIKIYKDRQKYEEWEFIFDLKSSTPGQGQGQPGLGQGAPATNQNGQPGQNGNTSNGTGSNGSSIFPGGFPSITSPSSSTSSSTPTNH